MSSEVFTIGHSTHTIEKFIALLSAHGIQAVADVRSSPFSKFNPQFNRENLQNSLKASGIRYVFLGNELGARSKDPACYVADKVQFDRLAQTTLFQSGLDRVIEGANSYRIALMCAEKDPLDCHRTILVARELVKQGVTINHILEDGSLESHTESIARLVTSLGMSLDDMFISRDEIIEQAYSRQANRVAYDQSESQARRFAEQNELSEGVR
ncbi:MAG: DUF488 domain-containing protein [Gammaproteobacteria bacterium]|nr:DUF488 domain-containing protein [Sideroxydans sp.]MBU4046560.1 DUF488 domain-containing protein [Gammaproteobacteria bacterium]MBU4150341.1 DUF488 domain-containing protein [Gammaproteobacteria bacterium]